MNLSQWQHINSYKNLSFYLYFDPILVISQPTPRFELSVEIIRLTARLLTMSSHSSDSATMADTLTTATSLDTQECAMQASQVMDSITTKLGKKRNRLPRNNVCRICEQRFTNSSALLRHVRCDHPETKQFKCVECGNRYERKLAFESHVRRHGAERTSIAVVTHGANHAAAVNGVERPSIAEDSDRPSYVVAGRELLS